METTTLDLGPTADELARVVAGVRDEQLGDPTPCPGMPVAGLLDHLLGLSLAFRLAAEKRPSDGGPSADAAALAPDWRTLLPARLEALAAAWRRPDAREGEAEVAGVRMPAAAMALVALDEVVVHGWDLAAATGQPYRPDPAAVEACTLFVGDRSDPAGEPEGLFGPAVPVPDDAPALHRLLGRTGRDPGWRPPG
ncbi:TIGR03086 family protein [Blastococcus sp. MG754426]|nr:MULTISPECIES: TIGR03086 family metal-binding protein [unclassified Blastococcus]MCF6509717.1 TIGR03086 family protein [Blastococcus sp. MG754426]MCF6514111.1 TIGR03086 family protein [Blastococcus sp. MG754427]MCF6737203.1 TIGR03086 family protein [Blastococcus sp. KM273129]